MLAMTRRLHLWRAAARGDHCDIKTIQEICAIVCSSLGATSIMQTADQTMIR
jgi:hypothetical protein